MGRKRLETKDLDVKRVVKGSDVYYYPDWNETTGRTDWKTTKETDIEKARDYLRRQREANDWKTLRGADMTFDAARGHWLEGNKHLLALEDRTRRYDEIRHVVGHLKLADAETPKIVNKLFRDMAAGLPVRRFADDGWRVMNSVKEHLHPNTI